MLPVIKASPKLIYTYIRHKVSLINFFLLLILLKIKKKSLFSVTISEHPIRRLLCHVLHRMLFLPQPTPGLGVALMMPWISVAGVLYSMCRHHVKGFAQDSNSVKPEGGGAQTPTLRSAGHWAATAPFPKVSIHTFGEMNTIEEKLTLCAKPTLYDQHYFVQCFLPLVLHIVVFANF